MVVQLNNEHMNNQGGKSEHQQAHQKAQASIWFKEFGQKLAYPFYQD